MHVVTGAFGYSGKYIAQRLLSAGHRVRTLTNSTDRENPFGDALEIHTYNFDRPDELANSLRGVAALYNTYWVRFDRTDVNYEQAVRNTRTLIDAAKQAGVRRMIHVSVTNPSEESNLPYFRAKAVLERAVKESGISYAILRPTVLFGREDILINNIAWILRRFPLFGVFGDGSYELQPIYVDDLAALAVEEGTRNKNVTIDAIGPETFTYRELVETIGRAIGKPRPIVHIPPQLGWMIGRLLGSVVGDVVITREEIKGLMENRLCTKSPPAGTTRLTSWMAENAKGLGRRYSSELARRRDRRISYEALRTK
jgi:NADH dehydrogenase